MSTQDDFNWNDASGDIVVPEQAAVAVYNNPCNDVVIRQAGRYGIDEDCFVVIDPSHALTLAKAILDKAGLADLAIVHVSQLRVQNDGGELLQPFPDRDTIDKVENAGRAADLVDDDDQSDDDDPAERKRKGAAERQRRRREKLKDRDNHGGSHAGEPNERDIDKGRVTTAPALPELDLSGGQSKALAH
jgi:hypothetical protein